MAIAPRPDNAGSNTAADHLRVISEALAQIPGTTRSKSILVRIDGADGSHRVIEALTKRRLAYSVGFTLPDNTPDLLRLIPEKVWTPAYDAHDQTRDGAWVAELTHLMDLTGWPAGMRVIVRKERPHPGAQLRFEDVDGMRITAFVTNTTTSQLADLELRHRRRARCEDRIRLAKDTGLANLPLHSFAANRIWCALVALLGPQRTTHPPAPGHPGTLRQPGHHRPGTTRSPRTRLTPSSGLPRDPEHAPGPGTGDQPARQRAACRTHPAESTPNPATEPDPDLTPQPDERSRLVRHDLISGGRIPRLLDVVDLCVDLEPTAARRIEACPGVEASGQDCAVRVDDGSA